MSANYAFGVVRATEPEARLTGRVMTKCTGGQDFPDGFSDTLGGPTFILRRLPPGEYLATIDYGDARSDRLTAEFTIGSP